MASKHQQKIINNYYEHQETILINRLTETVSELYLAEGKKTGRLWTTARDALRKLKVKPEVFDSVIRNQDVEGLAKIVAGLG